MDFSKPTSSKLSLTAAEARIKDLEEQLKQARLGTHPRLLQRQNDRKKIQEDEAERIEIHHELAKQRLKEKHGRQLAQNKAELDRRLKENLDTILKEIEEQERQVELEFVNAEIGKINTCVVHTSKKTLRGRSGGLLIEPPTYFNATPKPTTPIITPQVSYLLSDAEIQADMRHISQCLSQSSPHKIQARRLYEVSMSKQRLQYDGKAFKQGEEVTVENTEYGKYPARIELITEAVVSFKATQAWDTRQIHASYSDLVEGRVALGKKRNN